MFVQGEVYRRRDLHKQFGGQQQGGISTPSRHPIVLLFTGEAGEQHGYRDGWSNDGVFLYTGEGQHGDMQFSRGNLAIRDHAQQGRDLHLFEYVKADGKDWFATSTRWSAPASAFEIPRTRQAQSGRQ